MKYYISVDSGKYATKGIMRISRGDSSVNEMSYKSKRFLTRIDTEDVDFGLLGNDNTHFVCYNGVRYRVGDGAMNESYFETKQEEIHKICTYTMIALFGVNNGDSVVLGIGCPLSIFKNKRARIEYQRFMSNNHEPVSLTVDGKRYTFVIDKCVVFPESAGVVYVNYDKYRNRTVGVIDIGGLNTNCCVYQNIAPLVETVFTTRLGGKVMSKSLRDTLNSSLNLSTPLTEYQMPEIMKNGYVYDRRDVARQTKSKKIIHDYRIKHIQEIYDNCVAHNWAVDNMDIVFVGGTSLLLKEEIKEVFGVDDTYFYDNADMLNALGFVMALA